MSVPRQLTSSARSVSACLSINKFRVAAEAQGRRIGGGANQQRGQSKGRKQKRKEESPDQEDETRPMLCPNCKEMIEAE